MEILQHGNIIYDTGTGFNFSPWEIFHASWWSADFFQNQLFQKILSGIPSECQTDWIQIRPDILSGLIWVQTVCKGYEQTTDELTYCICLSVPFKCHQIFAADAIHFLVLFTVFGNQIRLAIICESSASLIFSNEKRNVPPKLTICCSLGTLRVNMYLNP